MKHQLVPLSALALLVIAIAAILLGARSSNWLETPAPAFGDPIIEGSTGKVVLGTPSSGGWTTHSAPEPAPDTNHYSGQVWYWDGEKMVPYPDPPNPYQDYTAPGWATNMLGTANQIEDDDSRTIHVVLGNLTVTNWISGEAATTLEDLKIDGPSVTRWVLTKDSSEADLKRFLQFIADRIEANPKGIAVHVWEEQQ
jgi:hypothetical protein